MATYFYYKEQLIDSFSTALSDGEALLQAAVISYDLRCPLKDIIWTVAEDFACIVD